MSGYKADRLSEDVMRELSMLMRGLKDPRVAGHMLSIVRVEMSGDGSHCKVYVSAMEGLSAAKTAAEGLKSASGYLRRQITDALHIRRCPEFQFIPDDSIAYSAKIQRMLGDLEGK